MGVTIAKKVFEVADAGLHNVKITRIEDLGVVESQFGAKEKILVVFECLDQQDSAGQNVEVWMRATKSVHEKSQFGKLLNVLKITPGDTFDTDDILGTRLQIVVVHNQKGNDTYANVDTFIALKNPQQRPAVAPARQAAPAQTARPTAAPSQAANDEDIPF